jgi:hypothetical protein
MQRIIFSVFMILAVTFTATAQVRDLQNWRPNDKRGLNIYEAPVEDTVAFDGLRIRVGGDFAMQFQGITQSNTMGNLVELGTDFNLPSANLNIDVQLLDGVRMHLRTYLSSRHHVRPGSRGGICR